MAVLPARVLVDMPNWLGDFIHTLPALQVLVAGNRGGTTSVLVPAAHAPLAPLAGVEPVVRPRNAGYAWARINIAGRFDVVLSARHSTRAKLIVAASGATVRIASAGRGARLLGLSTYRRTDARHQRFDLNDALARLGLAPPPPDAVRLPLPPDLRSRGREERQRLVPAGKAVALFPGTKGLASKRYPTERFAEVAVGLRRAGVNPLVVVGPGEDALAEQIVVASGAAVAATHPTLDEVAALLAACDAAVGNDSGLSHLAAVVGCPTVVLFGPTDPARTGPVGGGEVLRATPAAGVTEVAAMASIAAVDVVAAVVRLLAASDAQAQA